MPKKIYDIFSSFEFKARTCSFAKNNKAIRSIVFFIKMFLFYDGRIKITSNNGAVKTNFWVTLKESY